MNQWYYSKFHIFAFPVKHRFFVSSNYLLISIDFSHQVQAEYPTKSMKDTVFITNSFAAAAFFFLVTTTCNDIPLPLKQYIIMAEDRPDNKVTGRDGRWKCTPSALFSSGYFAYNAAILLIHTKHNLRFCLCSFKITCFRWQLQ